MLSVGSPAPHRTLQPIFGLPVALDEGTVVVAVLRPLSGATARMTITSLTEAFPRFDAEGIKVLGVTATDLTYARDFVPRYHVLFPIYADTTRELLGELGAGQDTGLAKTLLGLRPRHAEVLRALVGFGREATAAPGWDLPAWFVFRDGKVVYARYGSTALDQPEIEELWRAATSS